MATIDLKGLATKELSLNGSYRESGATALADDGVTDVTSTLVITNNISNTVAGTYTVTYTLPANLSGGADEVALVTTQTRSIVVTAPVGNVDTTFDLGDDSRFGTDTSDSKLNTVLDALRADPTAKIPANMSAYFSETAMDPYEVQHSK